MEVQRNLEEKIVSGLRPLLYEASTHATIFASFVKFKRQPTANQGLKWIEYWSSPMSKLQLSTIIGRSNFTLTPQFFKNGRGTPTMFSFIFTRTDSPAVVAVAAVNPPVVAVAAVNPPPPSIRQQHHIPGHVKELLKELVALKSISCPCCLDDIQADTLVVTSCGHLFCRGCLDAVMATALSQGAARWKCPCCRVDQ